MPRWAKWGIPIDGIRLYNSNIGKKKTAKGTKTMNILDTITANIEFTAEMTIRIGNSTMNIINTLGNAGRKTFTAEDIAHVINRSVKAEWNNVTPAQIERAIRTEVKHNARNEVRRGFKKIADLGMGFYQYGE